MRQFSSLFTQKVSQTLSFDYWLSKNSYYHTRVISLYSSFVPHDARVLHVQSGNGYILDALKPLCGVGVELDEGYRHEAQSAYGSYQFYGAVEDVPDQTFDFILLSFSTMETDDIHTLLTSIARLCAPHTRIVLERYPSVWAPVLSLAQWLKLKRPTKLRNWVSSQDLKNFMYLARLELVTQGGFMLLPVYIPLVSWLLNSCIAYVPLINRICLHQWMVLRSVSTLEKKEYSVSVVIPVRNEEGNIEEAVARCPYMGAHTEIIFVEGNSRDNTLAELYRIQEKYAERDITILKQEGKGKGDAVRKGFAHAKGDILMIQDGDLTAPPEDLPKFYMALTERSGEFINGSRLVYGMESGAMNIPSRLANMFFGSFLSWIVGQSITDSLCGTKVVWRTDYEKIAGNRAALGLADPFGDFDLLFGSAQLHLKIVDVPVHYKRRTYGTTNISRIKEVWFLLWMCFQAIRKIKIK